MAKLINDSVNQTLSRTLISSGTTFLTVLGLFLFGGEVLRGFAIALIWGIAIGTYSSICIAAAGLLNLRHSRIRGDDQGSKEAGQGATRGA